MKRRGLPWFRFYSNSIDDLVIARLSDGQYRIWSGLLCLTSEYGGMLPAPDVIAFRLRKSDKTIAETMEKLKQVGLIEATADGLRPSNWDELQYASDVSTQRVRAFRQRKRNVSGDVAETAPDTDTEADAETEQSEREASAPAPVKSGWPKNFRLTPEHITFASTMNFTPEDTKAMFDHFRDHSISHGDQRADWDATFRSWIRKQPAHGKPQTRAHDNGSFL